MVAAVAERPLALKVSRITRSGWKDVRSSDVIAARATAVVRDFDTFAARFGRGLGDMYGGGGAPREFELAVDGTTTDDAMADSAMVTISRGKDVFRTHLADAPSIMGHELGHALTKNTSTMFREATADVLGLAFDRWRSGQPTDWVIGNEAVRPAFEGIASRDFRTAVARSREELPALAQAALDAQDLHHVGPIHEALYRAASDPRVGENAAFDAFSDGILNDLDRRSFIHLPAPVPSEPPDLVGDCAREMARDIKCVARATLDAAARQHGRNSAQFAGINDAWKSLGLSPGWRPPGRRG